MSEATASHVSRYRPGVLAITSVAAACGIYILYSTYAASTPKTSLHRSNAVHRGRGGDRVDRQTRTIVEFSGATPEAPVGELVVRANGQTMVSNLAREGMFNAEDLVSRLGLPPNDVTQSQLNQTSVQCLLQACRDATSPEARQNLIQLGLGDLCDACTGREFPTNTDIDQISALLPEIPLLDLLQAISSFFGEDPVPNGVRQSPSESEEVTYAETEDMDGVEDENSEPTQGLKGLLYHIAETNAKRQAYEHRGIHCEGCGEQPIRGVRWHCLNCPDFDLCSTCEADNTHVKTHVFAKIKVPLPILSQPTKECPLWYPGDPRKIHPPLKADVKKRLQDQYELDGPQVDAHYDQFTCIANVPWPSDPLEIKGAIDRRAFNKALTSERWPQRFRPNLLYDRMFSFYDTNNDGKIGFLEFVDGMAYLRGSKRFAPLSRALEGFDIDGDGCVERKDFLRMLRAKHEIQKLILDDMIEGHESENTSTAMERIRSSQPISSIFGLSDIPQGEERFPQGKVVRNGDAVPLPDTKTILEDDEGWNEPSLDRRGWRARQLGRRPAHERLQEHMSRFEELLDSPTSEANGVHVGSIDGSIEPAIELTEPTNDTADLTTTRKRHGPTASDNSSESNPSEHPFNQDILWQFVEEGFQEMLDPLFYDKEMTDQEAIETRQEREMWRKEIDEEAQNLAASKETVAAQPENSKAESPGVSLVKSLESRNPRFVPTDPASLDRQEEELRSLPQQPLEDLLHAMGYSTIDGSVRPTPETAEVGRPSDQPEPNGINSNVSETAISSTLELTRDPTMPQNRPNSTLPPDYSLVESDATEEEDSPPPKRRLQHLALLEYRDRQMKLRGGPGRLSFDEIEEFVRTDTSGDLRGLVIGWLDWASF